MKKNVLKTLLTLIAVFSVIFVGCATGNNDESIPEGYIRINYQGDADNIWIWGDFDSAEVAKCGNWDTDKLPFESKNGNFVYVDLKLASNPKVLGMIPRKGTSNLAGSDIMFYFPMRYKEIYLKPGSTAVYVDSNLTKLAEGLLSANFTSGTEITINGSVKLSNETVTLKDKDGNIVSNIDCSTDNTTITLDDVAATYAQKCPYTLSVETSFGTDTVTVGLDSNLLENWFAEKAKEVNDLGVTFNGASATFKVWAPLASDVKLLVYDDVEKVGSFKPATVAAKSSGSTDEVELYGEPSIDPIAMTIDPVTGVWSYELLNYSAYKYYKYQIVNNGTTYYVCDIYAKAASPDSIAAQLVDINAGTTYGTKENYVNPFGNSGETQKSYADAVIYEMHIRDWAKAFNGEGKFIELAESEKFIAHLKEMGITHVQVVLMFDYAQVNSDENYNWGYNPYHYNVPEGRYVKDMKDGMDAVNQLRQFIKALHDAGIAINMDVVYNHTNGTQGGSLYDSTVPYYYYRIKADGTYSNGSGCGNETASNHKMFKKYMIESLKHWMLDYHINGFRFDLMGVHEADTMKEIYEELYKIDNKVMVYGEPWTCGTSAVQNGAKQAGSGTTGLGYGAFDDDFRNAIKGGEFGGFQKGHVQGIYNDKAIITGLTGAECTRNKTGNSALSIHYVECHDNYTLFDKLVYQFDSTIKGDGDWAPKFASLYKSVMDDEEKLSLVKKQNKLAAAYIFLSQGTPFINGGQEFMRTKKGDPDSYAPDTKGGIKWTSRYNGGTYVDATDIDDVNTIDLSFKTKYADVYNTYKGLIALRKSSTAFTAGTSSTAKTLSKGVTLYNAKSDSEEYEVIFNATDKDYIITDVSVEGNLGLGIKDYEVSFGRKGKLVTIKENDGTFKIEDDVSTVPKVPAKSFVILKK